MSIRRMDHVGIVVEDLPNAVAFFTELGLELEGKMAIEGEWADRIVGLKNVQTDIAMMKTPDGHGRIELTTYRNPPLVPSTPKIAPPNTHGLRNIMFEVDDIRKTVDRMRKLGAEVIGEITQYEDVYLLCYLRGPEGIIVALAEELD